MQLIKNELLKNRITSILKGMKSNLQDIELFIFSFFNQKV